MVVLVSAALAAGALPAAGAAGDGMGPASPVWMDEVVVTATRDREPVRDVPANVTVIDAEAIAESGAATLVELLERQEGIVFRSYSGNPAQSAIDLRGFGGDNPFGKALVLLDGRRLNRPDMFALNWLQIPLGMVERVEIVRGPNSVLYGDGAIGGVIHVITKTGEGRPRGEGSATAGSYGFHDEKISVAGSTEGVSYALTGENQQSAGYRERSAYEAQSLAGRVGWTPSESLAFSLGGSFVNTRYQLPGYLTREEMARDRRKSQKGRNDDDATERFGNANLDVRLSLGEAGRLESGFLYGTKDIRFLWYATTDTRIDTYAVTPKYVWETALLGMAHKLTVGLDWYHEPFRMDRYTDRQRRKKTGIASLDRDTLAGYARQESRWGDRLIAGLGYRREEATIQGASTDLSKSTVSFDGKKRHAGEAWEAALTYLPFPWAKVYGKAAGFYRFPFLDEQASYQGWGEFFSAELEKEKGVGCEVGGVLEFPRSWKLGVALYRMDMTDEIVWNYRASRNENLDRTRHDGIEANLSWEPWDWLRLHGNVTFLEATFQAGAYTGKRVPLVPRYTANLGADLRLPLDFHLQTAVRHAGESYLGGDYANTGTDRLDAYTTCDLYLHWRPKMAVLPGLGLAAFFGVENVAGTEYATAGYVGSWGSPSAYYPAPTRAFKGGIRLTF